MARQTPLCRYGYDPLDRLASRTPLAAAITRGFYRADRLATEIQGTEQRSFLHRDSQLLAQRSVVGKLANTALTVTDAQHSVLQADTTAIAYAPYGYHAPIALLPGFNGEHLDPFTGHYLLGNGYRAYNPTLMRFNRPDSLSPFGEGGLNAYAYCAGDPVNRMDPSGHESWPFIVGLTLSVVSLGTPIVTMFPSLPFKLSVRAARSGYITKGIASTIATSIVGVTSGSTSVIRAITAELEPDSPELEALGWLNFVLGLTALSTRIGSVLAARNPKNLAKIKTEIDLDKKFRTFKKLAISEAAIQYSAHDIRQLGPSKGLKP
jgi:RHS repeat-associated protein